MKRFNIVIDTNVVVAALRSRKGASFKLISLVESATFDISISVPLILEYESVLFRELKNLSLNKKDVEYFLDYLCSIGNKFDIYYLWRPFLKDPNDDFILELAVTSSSDFIVTFHTKDFEGVDKFGVKVLTPQEFLKLLEM